MFTQHTLESAPAASRPFIEATVEHLGHLPDAVSKLAESPEMLGGFLQASGLFEASTLDPLAQEVLVMTIATRNGCRVCIAMHTGRLRQLEADPALITALRGQTPVDDPRLEAMRQFTLRVLATTGDVPDDQVEEFLAAGYTRRNALEVVLGIGTYTMSTLANRLVKA
ncbi:carboxymuconolactone decarboxylase family protein [Actinoplanes sp. KI2]|uniref:carboxymuconolactone decarboxylase family protein n=1 Tax=Actinoplanes sp. KI2 TaxID=2983315 RepID=UPI0021D5DEEF|nr:carboxymuconolactone decarboxylase family protein [Actinoplanes sp. KI2]MCU7722375.1 carboxymuconolactone decarboxylase family protein [Actinoplanes sp. KI2]